MRMCGAQGKGDGLALAVGEQARLAPDFVCLTTSIHFAGARGGAAAALPGLVPGARFVLAGQVHGARVVPVAEPPAEIAHIEPKCDGLATRQRGVMLIVRTADCLPVVLVDAVAGACAALHAGWRGTLANIMEAGVEAMVALGARRDRITLWIGPGIQGRNYEVSPELIDEFQARHGHLGTFTQGRLLDLPRLNSLQAAAAGIDPNNIHSSPYCTFESADRYFSHRRQGNDRGQIHTVCGFMAQGDGP